MLNDKRIGIIGCGNMGEALLKGLLGSVKKQNILITDKQPARARYIKRRYEVKAAHNNLEIIRKSDIIILSVKPQEISGLLSGLSERINKGHLIISIAAGIKTAYIDGLLNGVPVVRVMPNMPALIGEGISAVSKGRYAKSGDMKRAKAIFKSVGDVVEVREKDMDAVTAVSGSGPAYFFYIIDALLKAGVKQGLKKDVSTKLALKTALGAARLISSSGLSAEELVKKVASKGGTTEAALAVFERRGLKNIINEAVRAAADRSRQLSPRP
ncbi:MAG: pyrroline-5-carboxylate reductase [Candidatus Omnitrophica bacterium CG1_02_49_10]|nr:MAG: pyrroline-5-carboxylate reductase [Candidatus Omnitrophica bacterium CG1_02_49_10]